MQRIDGTATWYLKVLRTVYVRQHIVKHSVSHIALRALSFSVDASGLASGLRLSTQLLLIRRTHLRLIATLWQKVPSSSVVRTTSSIVLIAPTVSPRFCHSSDHYRMWRFPLPCTRAATTTDGATSAPPPRPSLVRDSFYYMQYLMYFR
eukprot:COSAG02_NODE_3082_length_7406_cov_5.254379_2_plen_149_part_00